MSKFEKLVKRVLKGQPTSFEEAETLLLKLGFDKEVSGSHHVFRKKGYKKNISLKKRTQLLPYQLRYLREVLEDHDY